jgi:hypothetical protein
MITTPAARFRRWRSRTRACFLLGVGACLVSQAPALPGAPGSLHALLVPGVVLLGLTSVLYFRYCNRCPRCGVSFARAAEHQSSETDGLARFARIERCPFCAEPL